MLGNNSGKSIGLILWMFLLTGLVALAFFLRNPQMDQRIKKLELKANTVSRKIIPPDTSPQTDEEVAALTEKVTQLETSLAVKTDKLETISTKIDQLEKQVQAKPKTKVIVKTVYKTPPKSNQGKKRTGKYALHRSAATSQKKKPVSMHNNVPVSMHHGRINNYSYTGETSTDKYVIFSNQGGHSKTSSY